MNAAASEEVQRAHNLLLAIFSARDEVDSLHVPDVDFVPQDVSEDDLGNISGNGVTAQQVGK